MALIETLAPVIEFFLLSIEEAEHYFPNAEARRVKLIDNEFENLKCFFPWWLRSSGYPAYRAAVVSKDGKILARGSKLTNTSYFVRPALRVYLYNGFTVLFGIVLEI